MKFLVVDDHVLIREAMRGVIIELQRDAVVLEAGTCGRGHVLDPAACRSRAHIARSQNARPGRICERWRSCASAIRRYPSSCCRPLTTATMSSRRSTAARSVSSRRRARAKCCSARSGSSWRAGSIFLPTSSTRAPAAAAAAGQPAPAERRPSPAELGLTERQVEVLALMMQGKSNKLICRALDLAEPTVKNHVSAILKALGVSNRTEAVLAVAALGWELPRPAD